MKTLKEALAAVYINPVQAKALEAFGYCVVPIKATDEMLSDCEAAWRARVKDKIARRAIGEGGVQAPFVENWRIMLAARPKIEGE